MSAGGSVAGVLAAQLDDQPADPDLGQLGDVGAQPPGLVRQRDAGGEHQLAAAQQVGDVGHLGAVHPAHAGVEPVRAGDDAWLAAPYRVQTQHVGQSGQHIRDGMKRQRGAARNGSS